jgi:hypothetical protein
VRVLIPVFLLAVTAPLSAQFVGQAVAVRVCHDPRPFAASAAARDLVVHGRVLVAPQIVVGQPPTVRLEVIDVLKGRLDAPEITVTAGAQAFRAGQEWVLALPGAGTLYLERCGVHAVPVRDGQAVGRIDSMDGDQVVPLDRLRAG